jgi:hypothetical protein
MKSIPLLLLVSLLSSSFVSAQPAPQPPSSSPAWRPSQKTDAAATYTYTRFTLLGTFAGAPHDPTSNAPALVVDCIPGKGPNPPRGKLLAATLLVGTSLKIVYVEPEEIRGMSYNPKVALQFHTDDAKADKAEQWAAAADKSAAAIPEDSLKDILRAHRVAITADDDHGSQVAMRFDMPDPSAVEQGCNLNP